MDGKDTRNRPLHRRKATLLAAEARRAARPLIKSNNQCFSPTLSAITHRHRPRTPAGKARAAEALRQYRERPKAARQAAVGWVGLGGVAYDAGVCRTRDGAGSSQR